VRRIRRASAALEAGAKIERQETCDRCRTQQTGADLCVARGGEPSALTVEAGRPDVNAKASGRSMLSFPAVSGTLCSAIFRESTGRRIAATVRTSARPGQYSRATRRRRRRRARSRGYTGRNVAGAAGFTEDCRAERSADGREGSIERPELLALRRAGRARTSAAAWLAPGEQTQRSDPFAGFRHLSTSFLFARSCPAREPASFVDPPHINGSSMLLVDGTYHLVTSTRLSWGDLVALRYDQSFSSSRPDVSSRAAASGHKGAGPSTGERFLGDVGSTFLAQRNFVTSCWAASTRSWNPVRAQSRSRAFTPAGRPRRRPAGITPGRQPALCLVRTWDGSDLVTRQRAESVGLAASSRLRDPSPNDSSRGG